MLVRVLVAAISLFAALDAPVVEAADAPAAIAVVALEPAQAPPADPPTPPTINEFIPEDRSIGDCISALPKPGCGSEARGGWRQSLILVAILGGLGFIGWRVVRSARLARAHAEQP